MTFLHRTVRRPKAFTLVELLVVIGIIALLISILLPALGAVRRQSRKVNCMSNLRTIGQTLGMYVAESKGSLPWGFYSNRSQPTGQYQDWVSMLDYYMSKQARVAGYAAGLSSGTFTNMTTTPRYRAVSKVFKCPEVDRATFNMSTDYELHPVAVPSYNAETSTNGHPLGGPGLGLNARVAPAKINQIYPDTLLGWDTHAGQWPTTPDYDGFDFTTSFLVANSVIDGSNLTQPQAPDLRYRYKRKDPYASSVSKAQGLYITTYAPADRNGFDPDDFLFNHDSTDGFVDNSQLGNLRFRHSKETECNVLMGDLSVQTIKFDKRQNHPQLLAISYLIPVRRAQVRLRWPTGVSLSVVP